MPDGSQPPSGVIKRLMFLIVLAMENQQNFGEKLQQQTSGVMLSTRSLSCRRSMTKGQIEKVANLFEADGQSVSGSRAVISRKHDLVAPIYSLISEAKHYIAARTIDYPEQRLRLCRLDQIEPLRAHIATLKEKLAEHLEVLDANWASVKAEAKERLAELYDESDYASKPSLHYGIHLSFPAIKPDDRLKQLNPALYAEEQARIQAQFAEAVKVAEAQAAAQIQGLLKHLLERLQPGEDGTKKRLNESAVTNLQEAVQIFQAKTIGSNDALEALMQQVKLMSDGLDVAEIRKATADDRAKVAEQIQQVLMAADSMVEAMPVRSFDLDEIEELATA